MLDKRTLNRINDRPRSRGLAPYAALGVVALAVLLALFSYALAAAVLLVGAGVVFLLHTRDVAARTVMLTYDLDAKATSGFDAVREACEALSGAQQVWRVEEGASEEWAYPDGETFAFDASCRHLVEVGLLKTPGISANVDIWGIKTDAASLFFLPECVLLYKENRYRAVSYDSLSVVYQTSRTLENEDVPEDAEVVGETWRFVKPDGGPDLRYPNNPKGAIASYGLLCVTGMESQEMRLLVSNKAAAVRFERAFGSGRDEQRPKERGRSVREEKARQNAEAEIEKASSLLGVLGVAPGASREDINAAYKKKAKMYHPDRVTNLAPEVREVAELRMKEINAAYGELKRRTR